MEVLSLQNTFSTAFGLLRLRVPKDTLLQCCLNILTFLRIPLLLSTSPHLRMIFLKKKKQKPKTTNKPDRGKRPRRKEMANQVEEGFDTYATGSHPGVSTDQQSLRTLPVLWVWSPIPGSSCLLTPWERSTEKSLSSPKLCC